jgi:RNA polymerase sigma factor (sigma-70 family)
MHNYRDIVFNDLYIKYKKDLQYFINKIINDIQISEDIVQECFIRFYNYTTKHQITEINIRAFLYKIAKNCAINYIIKNKKKNEVSIDLLLKNSELFYHDKFDNDYYDLYEVVLNSNIFDEKLKQIFDLKCNKKKSNLEIALKLKLSERTIRRKINEIYNFIRNNYKINDYIN